MRLGYWYQARWVGFERRGIGYEFIGFKTLDGYFIFSKWDSQTH